MIHQVLWRFLHFLLLFCCCMTECDPFAQRLEHFYERGVLELDLLPRDKIQDGTAKEICTIFSLSNLSAFVLKTKKKVSELYFYKAQRKILHWIYFVIEILEKMQQIFNRDCKQVAWLIYHWRTWTEVIYKVRQTFWLDLFILVA